MKHRLIILLVLFTIILAACASVVGDATSPTPVEPTSSESGDGPSSGGAMNESPLNPIAGEENMARGEAFISSAQLLILESDPLQIRLLVQGSLPTPCHQLRGKVDEPDEQDRIQVNLYSLVDPEAICIQVLQSFETEISLGSYPEGSYTVWLNGEQVGEFNE